MAKHAGTLTTHVPPPGAAAAGSGGVPPFPWLELKQHGRSRESFRYWISLSSAQQQQQQQQERPGTAAAAVGSKRKADALRGGDAPPAMAAEGAVLHRASPKQEQQQPNGQQRGVAPAALGLHQQQQQGEPEVCFTFSSYDGSMAARAACRGFRCPLSSCRGLRCHSYEGLRQHLAASHSYHAAHFMPPPPPGGTHEVFLRCKPGALLSLQGCPVLQDWGAGSMRPQPPAPGAGQTPPCSHSPPSPTQLPARLPALPPPQPGLTSEATFCRASWRRPAWMMARTR